MMKLIKGNKYNPLLMSECFAGWTEKDENETAGMNMWHFFDNADIYKGASEGIEPTFDFFEMEKKIKDRDEVVRLEISEDDVNSLLGEISKVHQKAGIVNDVTGD